MNKLFFLFIFIYLLFSCKKQSDAVKQDIISSNDSVTISVDDVNYTYTKEEFRIITDSFPQLSKKGRIIENPDIVYTTHPVFVSNYTFGSEAGQDHFYILYAYFLKQENGDKYDKERQDLTKIYRAINDFYALINRGGTYFGHQYNRILGYVEYDIYKFINDSTRYDIRKLEKEKKHFTDRLKKISDRFLDHEIMLYGEKSLQDEKEELEKILDDINKLITSGFYLKKARDFRRDYYNYEME